MNELTHINKKQFWIHLSAWALIIIYDIIKTSSCGSLIATIVCSSLFIANYMFVFYSLGFFVFPKFWENKLISLIIGIFVVYILYFSICMFITYKMYAFLGCPDYNDIILIDLLRYTMYFFIIVGSAGIASFFSRYGLFKLKNQSEREKILLIKEISFIKNQFNSKVTLDFLNYCNTTILPVSQHTAESIDIFSNMLKYTSKIKPDEIVLLKDEIEYIENFLSIQKLLSSKVFVIFNRIGISGEEKLLPRILITFVENAFKHGLSNNPEHPIEINLKVESDEIFFTIINMVNPNKKMTSSHTGLENVRQILNLHYNNNYSLDIKEEQGKFYVELRFRLILC